MVVRIFHAVMDKSVKVMCGVGKLQVGTLYISNYRYIELFCDPLEFDISVFDSSTVPPPPVAAMPRNKGIHADFQCGFMLPQH